MASQTHYLYLGSRHDRLSEPTWFEEEPEYQERYLREYACPGYHNPEWSCLRTRSDVIVTREPLGIIVTQIGKGFARTLGSPLVNAFHRGAMEFFAPYLPASHFEQVKLRTKQGLVDTEYFACLTPPGEQVDFNRGRVTVRPKVCSVCGLAYTWSSKVSEMGILRWQARERPVLVNGLNLMAVTPEFFHDMKLKERFPDIKVVHKIKLYDKDPRGWVLPGDPEWDGILRTPDGWREWQPPDPTYIDPKREARLERMAAEMRKLLGEE